MKSQYKLLSLIIGVALLTACNKVKPEIVDGTITEGLWYVKSYSVNFYDDPDNFKGYKFDFKVDGSVSAANGTKTIDGFWSSVKGGQGHKRSQTYVQLNCPSGNHFEDLCRDWHVLAIGPTNFEMEFQDGTDYIKLIFKKH